MEIFLFGDPVDVLAVQFGASYYFPLIFIHYISKSFSAEMSIFSISFCDELAIFWPIFPFFGMNNLTA
jgi:hypothetical protein